MMNFSPLKSSFPTKIRERVLGTKKRKKKRKMRSARVVLRAEEATERTKKTNTQIRGTRGYLFYPRVSRVGSFARRSRLVNPLLFKRARGRRKASSSRKEFCPLFFFISRRFGFSFFDFLFFYGSRVVFFFVGTPNTQEKRGRSVAQVVSFVRKQRERGGEVFNAYIYARARVRDLNEKTH